METTFITKINMRNKNGIVEKFKFKTKVYIPLEKAISMAIDEIGLDVYIDLKYHTEFYSTQRIN